MAEPRAAHSRGSLLPDYFFLGGTRFFGTGFLSSSFLANGLPFGAGFLAGGFFFGAAMHVTPSRMG